VLVLINLLTSVHGMQGITLSITLSGEPLVWLVSQLELHCHVVNVIALCSTNTTCLLTYWCHV